MAGAVRSSLEVQHPPSKADDSSLDDGLGSWPVLSGAQSQGDAEGCGGPAEAGVTA